MNLNKRIGLLNNKMKYILLKNKCSSTTTILFTIKCGSKNERKGEYGLSHFIEHMLFKGTKKRLTSKNISNSLKVRLTVRSSSFPLALSDMKQF